MPQSRFSHAVHSVELEAGPELNHAPDPELVERAAHILGAAERPALYLGRGAAWAGAGFLRLAEQLAAPVVTTIHGKGVFPEHHPLWLWNALGAQAPRFVRRMMGRCDCLLAVGCGFSETRAGDRSGAALPEQLLHVDVDPGVFNRCHRAALAVVGDAALVVRGVLGLISGVRPRGKVEAAIAAGHRRVAARCRRRSSAIRVNPGALFAALQRHGRPGAVFATDGGNSAYLAMEHLRLDEPGRFVAPEDLSGAGHAVPAAIAAAIARSGGDVIALLGDHPSLMKDLGLITGASHRALPMVVVLGGAERPECTLEAMAQTVGCRYFRMLRDYELDSVLPAALELVRCGTPAVIEVAIDTSQDTYFRRGSRRAGFWRLPWRRNRPH